MRFLVSLLAWRLANGLLLVSLHFPVELGLGLEALGEPPDEPPEEPPPDEPPAEPPEEPPAEPPAPTRKAGRGPRPAQPDRLRPGAAPGLRC